MNDNQPRRGFTMVELLVVVAVIAVLASLLLPALRNAQEAGKASDCVNNMRQIYTAFALFADDNDDYFPFTYYWWRTLGTAGYLGTGQLHGGKTTTWWKETRWPAFRCGGEKGGYFNTADPNCIQPNPLVTAYDSDLDHCSYAMQWSINQYNYYASYCNPPPCSIKSRRGFSKQTDCPGGRSAAPLIVDKGTPSWGWVGNYTQSNIDNANQYYVHPYEGANYYSFRHPGKRANILYLDGHVEAVRHKNETGKPNWVWVWNNPPD